MITNLIQAYVEQFSFNVSVFKEEYSVIFIFLIVAIVLALVIAVLSYTFVSQKPESEKLSSSKNKNIVRKSNAITFFSRVVVKWLTMP